jgi:Late embryogenesis abundant protein
MRAALAFLATSALLSAASSAAAPVPSVRELRVGPIAEAKTGMELIFTGPAAPCGERLKGSFSVFGSGAVPVDGTVAPHPEGGCSVRFEMPFLAVGPEVLTKADLSAVGWSLGGELSGKGKPRPMRWSGSILRDAVKLTESMKITLKRFVAVKETHVESLGVGKSTLNVDLELKNPLAFDLRFVEAAYELTVDGKPLAKGRRGKFLLHAGRANLLMLPVELSHDGVLSGLWKAATGGRVEGVLTGIAKLRVPAGELEFPFEFPVKLSRK